MKKNYRPSGTDSHAYRIHSSHSRRRIVADDHLNAIQARWRRWRYHRHGCRILTAVYATGPQKTPAGHADDDVDHKQKDRRNQAVHSDRSPEHGPS